MTAIELRSEIIEMVKQTEDIKVLAWLKGILSDPAMSQEMVDDMVYAAEMSEEDIAAGRTYTIEETKQWLADRKKDA